MAFIKNIEHDTVLKLVDQIQVQPGQIVSKTLSQNEALSMTLFAFSKGEEIGTHDSNGDAMVYVLEGEGKYTVGDTNHILKAGDTLIMPAKIAHSIYALSDLKWLLMVVFK